MQKNINMWIRFIINVATVLNVKGTISYLFTDVRQKKVKCYHSVFITII